MITTDKATALPDDQRIVMTRCRIDQPQRERSRELRENLLAGRSGVQPYEIRYVGETLAGICDFPATQYQTRKDARRD